MIENHLIIKKVCLEIQNELANLDPFSSKSNNPELIKNILEQKISGFEPLLAARITNEILGCGPLQELIDDISITEIMVTRFDQIWIERESAKEQVADHFISNDTYEKFVNRFCHDRNIQLNFEYPFAEFSFESHRWTFVFDNIARGKFQICIRRKTFSTWTLTELENRNFLSSADAFALNQIVSEKKNYLIVGATGSGKTTLLNAMMRAIPSTERIIILEDTEELTPPNNISAALCGRKEIRNQYGEINLQDLLKVSLRLRPDRLAIGEIRGSEAKDLLLALSTGHAGSFSTMHAEGSAEALLRLEMLIQMGAPPWKLESIRRLIQLSIHGIIVVGFVDGQRRIKSIDRIVTLEETGFTLEPIYYSPRSKNLSDISSVSF